MPSWTTIKGDIRLSPFYPFDSVQQKVESFVAEINVDPAVLANRGPVSKYVLNAGTPNEHKGVLALRWGSQCIEGVACNIDSPGFEALKSAIKVVKGEAKPWSSCSTLPLVKGMQLQGFDIQITGFGVSSVYHADNEYCLLSEMQDGFKVLHQICCKMENRNKGAKNKELY